MITPERIQKYLERRQEDLDLLDASLAKKDFDSIRGIGHKIKGNAALFGFGDLGEIAKSLETEAENRAEARCLDLRNQIEAWLRAKRGAAS